MIDHPLMLLVLFPLAAYVIGATPFGFVIARAKGIDLRKAGSGNVGATNCGRTCGRGWGYLCFLMDVAKGMIPVLVVSAMFRTDWAYYDAMVPKSGPPQWMPSIMQQTAWLLTGCCAIAGHVFSFWLRFRGGKGVATSLGVVLGIWPFFTAAGAVALGVWVIVTLITRYVSLGSIVAALAFLPAFVCLWPPMELWPMATFASAMVALIILRHRGNISRLIAGTENKIGSGKKHPAS